MTAVEWLADEIIMLEEKLRLEEININDFMDAKDELVLKALEMEQTKAKTMKIVIAIATFVSSVTLLSLEQYLIGGILLGVSLRLFYKF